MTPSTAAQRRPTLGGAALVLSGGVVGTLLRAGLGEALPWAWATLAVNLVGALALGVLVGARADGTRPLRLFLGTGLLGSFTTYSALAFLTATHPGAAYGIVTVVGGLALAGVGLILGQRVSR